MPMSRSYEDYYTAAQAMKVLQVTDGMFYNFVRNGDLEGVKLPGRKQSVYEKSKVNQLARELKAFVVTRQKHASVFERATVEDVPACAKISDDIFGGAHFDIEKQVTWMKKNPDICYVVKSEGEVVGYVLMLPLDPKKIERILREEEFALDIDVSEVGEFIPGKPLHLYMASIAVTPSVTLAEKRAYGSRLVGGLLDVLINLGKRGIILETIVARSTKPDGIRLLRGIGFTEILSITDKKNFLIEVEKSGIKEIVEYKEALKESGVFTFPQTLDELPTAILTAKQTNSSNHKRKPTDKRDAQGKVLSESEAVATDSKNDSDRRT